MKYNPPCRGTNLPAILCYLFCPGKVNIANLPATGAPYTTRRDLKTWKA